VAPIGISAERNGTLHCSISVIKSVALCLHLQVENLDA
jgi:hypothetical protein